MAASEPRWGVALDLFESGADRPEAFGRPLVGVIGGAPGASGSITGAATPLTELIKAGTTGDLQPPVRPEGVDRVEEGAQQRPAAGCIDPAQADELIGPAEDRDIPQHAAIGLDGVNAAHRLAVADALMQLWVVVGGIDVNERQPGIAGMTEAVALGQEAHFTQAERATAVVEEGELNHGLDPRQKSRAAAAWDWSGPPLTMLRQSLITLTIATNGEELRDLTSVLNREIASSGLDLGLATLTCLHTSCSLTVNENADPAVREDLAAFLKALVPPEGVTSLSGRGGLRPWCHDDEGPDDMPAHIRTALTTTSLSLPIQSGRLLLGTWQAVYLWEHRRQPHRRQLSLHLLGA